MEKKILKKVTRKGGKEGGKYRKGWKGKHGIGRNRER